MRLQHSLLGDFEPIGSKLHHIRDPFLPDAKAENRQAEAQSPPACSLTTLVPSPGNRHHFVAV